MTQASSFEIKVLPEPKIVAGYGQHFLHPRDGLFLAGPLIDELQPKELQLGAIGTVIGLELFAQFSQRLQHWIAPRRRKHPSPGLQAQAWPGFSAAFSCAWPSKLHATAVVNEEMLRTAIRAMVHHEAVHDVVSLLEGAIDKHLLKSENNPKVWFLVIPDDTFRYGTPARQPARKDRHRGKVTFNEAQARHFLRHGSLLAEDIEAAQIFRFRPDVHDQLKARLLQGKGAIVQFIREKTLRGFLADDEDSWEYRHSSDPTEIAWNICTTTYYKAAGKPWKLAFVRPGVCYVGLVFKRDPTESEPDNACCAAQMFLDSGDGVVFRGILGPWYSQTNKQLHLKRDDAAELVRTIRASYRDNHDKAEPIEIFIHGRTRFNDEEVAGFIDGAEGKSTVYSIRIRSDRGLKLFRPKRYPVLRGTAMLISKRFGYLWTRGTVPYLRTFIGSEVPNPLSIEIVSGEPDLETVMKDVLMLTKVNFNSCMFSDGLPVTLRFADSIGNILTSAPIQPNAPWPFKHYI